MVCTIRDDEVVRLEVVVDKVACISGDNNAVYPGGTEDKDGDIKQRAVFIRHTDGRDR